MSRIGTFTYTLLADGSSDAALMAIIEWTIAQIRPDLRPVGEFARDLGSVGSSLTGRLQVALDLFPCDILFIHRDAEKLTLDQRRREIADAVGARSVPWVPVVPVAMTEAWLLSDASAIRSAAGNRSGTVDLKLPPQKQWELSVNPKALLFAALCAATEKSGRALAKFTSHDVHRARRLVAAQTADFSRLRGLESFDAFERALASTLKDF